MKAPRSARRQHIAITILHPEPLRAGWYVRIASVRTDNMLRGPFGSIEECYMVLASYFTTRALAAAEVAALYARAGA